MSKWDEIKAKQAKRAERDPDPHDSIERQAAEAARERSTRNSYFGFVIGLLEGRKKPRKP